METARTTFSTSVADCKPLRVILDEIASRSKEIEVIIEYDYDFSEELLCMDWELSVSAPRDTDLILIASKLDELIGGSLLCRHQVLGRN